MKTKLTSFTLVIGLALVLVIGTTLPSSTPAKAAVAAPAAGTLYATKLGTGDGTIVTVNFPGLNCGPRCQLFFGETHTVVVSATANSESVFSGWSGDCSGTNITCTVTMLDDRTVTASFTRVYTASVAKEGNGSGTVTSVPGGIDCGATCDYQFFPGTLVTLTAAEDTGSVFNGWAGDCAANGYTCVTTMNAEKYITPTFTLITYTVAVSKTGDGTGSVTSTPAGIDCGETCSAIFDYNTPITYTASPITGSRISSWAGNCAAAGPICVSSVTTTQNITATFQMITTNLSVHQSYMRHGSALTFTLVVVNHGPTSANGTIVSDTISPDITRPQWSCQAANGASCPNVMASAESASCSRQPYRSAGASGNGYLLHETLPALPVGGIVTYTIRGNLCTYITEMTNQADITLPEDVHDLSHADNSATLTIGHRIMIPLVLR